MFTLLIDFIRSRYRTSGYIPLHEPRFGDRESKYINDALNSGYVSSIGKYVDYFEQKIAEYCDVEKAVALVNGTAALHLGLVVAGVERHDIVITQPLTFVATCNAISYIGATPVFIDVDLDTMSLSPDALEEWLQENACLDISGFARDKSTNQTIRACMPMHTFGHPARIEEIVSICGKWNIAVVEDAAEALGSLKHGRHVGTFGEIGALSFNGNKLLTTGGGGMIITNTVRGSRAKFLSTTAKLPHTYEYYHAEIGFNYRMPNLNAALGCAQLESLEYFIQAKRELASAYADFFNKSDFKFVTEPPGSRSNYWLNTVICTDRQQRDVLLHATNSANILTRPVWSLMTNLPPYSNCRQGPLNNASWLEARALNLPSSVPPSKVDNAL